LKNHLFGTRSGPDDLGGHQVGDDRHCGSNQRHEGRKKEVEPLEQVHQFGRRDGGSIVGRSAVRQGVERLAHLYYFIFHLAMGGNGIS
jgi:hypothetical protein